MKHLPWDGIRQVSRNPLRPHKASAQTLLARARCAVTDDLRGLVRPPKLKRRGRGLCTLVLWQCQS